MGETQAQTIDASRSAFPRPARSLSPALRQGGPGETEELRRRCLSSALHTELLSSSSRPVWWSAPLTRSSYPRDLRSLARLAISQRKGSKTLGVHMRVLSSPAPYLRCRKPKMGCRMRAMLTVMKGKQTAHPSME